MKNLFILFMAILFSHVSVSEAKTVTDQLGRIVTVPDNPERVVSLAPNVTEIIFALEKEALLAGATIFSDYPKAATNLPKVGSYVRLNIEKIVSLSPDLCIGIKDGNPKKVIDKLEKLKIPVYAVNPQNLESVINTVIEIGLLLNAEKKAKILAEKMQKRIDKIKFFVKKISEKPKIFFQIDTNAIISAGTGTFINELIETAGGINLACDSTQGYPRFGREQIIAMSPDIIVIASMKQDATFEKAKNKWTKFNSIPAVKNDKIFFVNADLINRPSTRLVKGLEIFYELFSGNRL